MTKFRPQQQVLDIFWALSDGNDDQRSTGAVKLAHLIKTSEVNEKKEILQYCQERLVRGLSSGRKFARVGFSVALVQLLRENDDIDTISVLSTVKDKLKVIGHDRKSQSEIGGIYLGQVFAVSALIQAGRVVQLSGPVLSSLVEELFRMADRKSYLRVVCDRIIQDLVVQVPADVFGEHVWPKMKEKLKQGWHLCTLDRLALLLACRARFPKVVRRKFLRKHWGLPVLCEANDTNLLTAVLTSVKRSEILVDQVLPSMLESDRDVVSVWRTLGEKLMEKLSEKKFKTMVQRQLLGLKVASKLLANAGCDDQAVDVLLSPGLARLVFDQDTTKNNPNATEAVNSLCQQVCERLATGHSSVLAVLERIWKLEAAMTDQEHFGGRVELVNSNNFLRIVDLMSKSEADGYSHALMAMIMGNDKWKVLAHDPARKLKQIECCLRQLQHLSTSLLHSVADTQHSILALFLRLAFFNVMEETQAIEHCDSSFNLQDEGSAQKLSEVYFYKCLDSLCTLITGQQKKWEYVSTYLDLLYGLAQYVQDLLNSETVIPVKRLPPQVRTEWIRLVEFCQQIREKSDTENQSLRSAFLLLVLFLGFYMLSDIKVAVDLLQDVYVCYEKAEDTTKETNMTHSDTDPDWSEVFMDVLLKVMSLHSHLSRVIAASVFRLMSEHISPNVVTLITEVLVSSNSQGNDTDGVLVETDDDNEDEDNLQDEDQEDSDHSDDDGDDEIEPEDDASQIVDVNVIPVSADGHHSEEESLPDLSDSEMFKMDDMLAEVFRQRQKSGKKAREEKRQELINFQIRVLDFVEVLIKGGRCGDFVFNLVKPLLLLLVKSSSTGRVVLAERAQTLFTMIKSKSKGLKDSIHTTEDQKDLFRQLLDLAKTVTDKRHIHQVAHACHVLTNISLDRPDSQGSSRSCVELVMNHLEAAISKKSPKPHVTFFSSLIELDPVQFQDLAPRLVERLKQSSVRPHERTTCCLLLASLCKKTDMVKGTDLSIMRPWMREAVEAATKLVLSLDKVIFYKDVMTLMVALQARQDVFVSQVLFGADVKGHLKKMKSKFNTDIRRLANRIISSIDQENSQSKTGKKRKASDSDVSSYPSQKRVAI